MTKEQEALKWWIDEQLRKFEKALNESKMKHTTAIEVTGIASGLRLVKRALLGQEADVVREINAFLENI